MSTSGTAEEKARLNAIRERVKPRYGPGKSEAERDREWLLDRLDVVQAKLAARESWIARTKIDVETLAARWDGV